MDIREGVNCRTPAGRRRGEPSSGAARAAVGAGRAAVRAVRAGRAVVGAGRAVVGAGRAVVGAGRAVVGAGLLVVGVPAGLVGCTSSSGPELLAPPVHYVSRDPQNTDQLHIAEKRAAGATVTFDARDLAGVAVLRTAMDACPVRLPVFQCAGQDADPSQNFRLTPARGAKAGDSAVLRYRVTVPGRPAVTGSSRIVVGKPELVADARPDRPDVDPGGRLAVSLTLRNTGDVPARGVALRMTTRDGLAPAVRHGNCRYRDSRMWCRLPAADVVIPPGASYRLGTREVLRAAEDATYPGVTFEAAALGTDYVPPAVLASQYASGDGAALRLVPADARDDGTAGARDRGTAGARGGGTADSVTSEVEVAVRNTSDLVAVAGGVKGPVGSRATVRIGVRNDGPGALPVPVRVEFTVPAGTTVVSSPYEFDRDEEVIDQECRAIGPYGTPLVAASEKQPSARRYVCTARTAAVGATTAFPFTLRIDEDVAHRGGRVTVSGGEAGRPSHDTASANDTAEVTVAVWPGPSWATPGALLAAAIVLAVLVLGAALGIWRRGRRSR